MSVRNNKVFKVTFKVQIAPFTNKLYYFNFLI